MRASRRQVIARAGAMAAGATIPAPALADPSPEVRWTMTSAFQPGLDFIVGGAQIFAQSLSDMTDGHFSVTIRPPGEIASAVDALDAVADGKAECAHTALAYSWNTNPGYAFGTGAPFGMNARQHTAWLQDGGGNALIDETLADRNLLAMPLGDTGGQMAGWFRKEVHAATDLARMKVRIGGFAGKVFETLGASCGRRAQGWDCRGPFQRVRSMPSNGPVHTTTKSFPVLWMAVRRRFPRSPPIIIIQDGGRGKCSCIS